jgi:NTP pyrophosphatase (non-canonical NTP hydrolase)
MSSSIDQRRLRDGAAALAASNEAPRTRAEAEAQRAQISDAIAAMQSLDDLGVEGNRQAMRDLDDLIRRYDALGEQIRTMEARDAVQRLPRDQRQVMITAWARAAFGEAEATGLPQRGLRLLEEAIEAFQACGGNEAIAHELVGYVFGRPPGEVGQELGGVAVTVLALAAAAGLSADEEECREIHRVLGKPLSTFTQRNAAKNAAGFKIT